MRVFIGINFNDEIKSQLTSFQNNIRSNSVKGNFTLNNNFHLTLRYIGEVNSKELYSLKRIVSKVATNSSCFSFKVKGIDEFRRHNSSIVFAGVEKTKELDNLYHIIDKELRIEGFELDTRPYNPHITLGREVQYQPEFNIKNISYTPIDIQVKSLVLFESTRIKGVLTYVPLIEVNFKNDDKEGFSKNQL